MGTLPSISTCLSVGITVKLFKTLFYPVGRTLWTYITTSLPLATSTVPSRGPLDKELHQNSRIVLKRCVTSLLHPVHLTSQPWISRTFPYHNVLRRLSYPTRFEVDQLKPSLHT